MKKCDCGFSTLDDSFDFCYKCGKKLRPVTVEPAFQEENTEAAAFKCADCGHIEEFYTPSCPKCGGEIVALAYKNIGVVPPVFEGERGKIKRCSNCDYSTNNLTYERCPVCSCPLADAEGFPKDIQLSVMEISAGAQMSNFSEKEEKREKRGVSGALKKQNRKTAAVRSGTQSVISAADDKSDSTAADAGEAQK